MEKEFVTYEQALALKELGFDEPCLLSLSWINGYNTYTEKSNEPKAWISSNVEIKYDFSQFKVDFKDVYHVEIQIPLYQQAINFLYICSNKQIDIELKGSDTYEERVRKINQGCEDLRNLQNNKSNQ